VVAAGFLCVIVGAALHWPDFVMASSMHWRMVGIPFSPTMIAGMGFIGLGLVLAAVGVVRPSRPTGDRLMVRVDAMDDRRLTVADILFVSALMFGMVIDVMKPATIGFVIPGARAEYGLTTLEIALWPLVALFGTAVGSLAWGALADRIGRRGGLLLATLLFIATSICGAMPAFWLNLVTCFLMGASAGGMLPLVFALLAEVAPQRHRGLLGVLVGGIGSTGGYVAASVAAAALVPSFSWRVLWLIGLPTGVVMLALTRYIPESPRFLVLHGREDEARRSLQRYGASLAQTVSDSLDERIERGVRDAIMTLLRPPFAVQTFGLVFFGFAWGLANFGFLTWLPTLLGKGAGSTAVWNGVLAKSAVVALVGGLVVVWLYARWRTRASIVTFAVVTSLALVVLGIVMTSGGSGFLIGVLVILFLIGINGSYAMVSVYAAEVFPTVVRGRGTGLIAAATKTGGLLGPQLVALILVLGGGATVTALLVAVPLLGAGLVLWLKGVETRDLSLANIQTTMQ